MQLPSSDFSGSPLDELASVLLEWGGEETDARGFFTDVFRLGGGLIQRSTDEPGHYVSNPIILGSKDRKVTRRILFEDTFMDTLGEFMDDDWVFVSGCSYFGRRNTGAHQGRLFDLGIDLDGVDTLHLTRLLSGIDGGWYPKPTYITLSGHGVHLHYVLDEPLSLYPDTKQEMKKLKYRLIDKIWNPNTSTEEHVQHQGINQGFRIPGSKTKLDGVRARVFRYGPRIALSELAKPEYVGEREGIDLAKVGEEARVSLTEARELWPEWYERRVVGGAPRGKWRVKRDLYDWWLRVGVPQATYGHRYFTVMCLAIYAAKCPDVPREELERDARDLVPRLNALRPDHPFTEADAASALECYDERYCTFPRDDMARISGVSMPANKRNGRPREKHLMIARFARDLNYEDPDGPEGWRKGGGRPEGSGTKRDLILDYAERHPGANHSEIARNLGVSRQTVIKWLRQE